MFDDLSDDERIELAKAKMRRVMRYFDYLIGLHENNAIILYSDQLSSQIPRSRAARAFNVFQEGMHQIVVVRLCALWDKPGLERDSVPSVVELIDKTEILHALAEQARQSHLAPVKRFRGEDHDETTRGIIMRHQEERARSYAEQAERELRAAILDARNLAESERFASLRELRNTDLAHTLDRSEEDPIRLVEWADETKVLEATAPILERLYSWINNVGYSLAESRETWRDCSNELWNSCSFSIETRGVR